MAAEHVDPRALIAENNVYLQNLLAEGMMRVEERLGQMENFMKSMADDASTRTTRLRSLIDEVEQHGQ